MATLMRHLLEEISRNHYPNPPATPEEIEAFEQRVGWRLDPDLRAFYLHCNGADLFKPPPDTPFRLRPLSQLERSHAVPRPGGGDQYDPTTMYTLCYVQDGDYVLLDVSRQIDSRYPLIDGWHETFPERQHCKQIANSFSEFLEKALRSGGQPFWLDDPAP